MDLSAYVALPGIARHLDSMQSADRAKGAVVLALAKAGGLRPLPLPLLVRLSLEWAYASLSLRSAWWLLWQETPVRLLLAYRDRTNALRTLVRQRIDNKSSAALLQDLDELFYTPADPTRDALRHLSLAFFLHAALHQLLSGRVPDALIHDLGQGIPNNFTTEVSLDLWQLAVEGRPLAAIFAETPPDHVHAQLNETDEGCRWWARFEELLHRHGHRGEVELDIAAPRWREAPRFLLQTITNYLRHPDDQPSPVQILRAGIIRREQASVAIRAKLSLPLRPLFDWLYHRYVLWMPFREAGKYTWLLGLERSRNIYRELGRRLLVEGQLGSTDDVFWLHLDELSEWAQSGSVGWSAVILQEREQQWKTWSTLRPPAVLIGNRGLEPAGAASAADSQGAILRGTPASYGMAEGIARVMIDPHDADLRAGEILVTRYTDPAWTPLFFTAAALITEVGGVLSHGAVVAREIGLPAIVGVDEATSRIRSGQRLRVNATEGTVELLLDLENVRSP